jgi:hypothetical protein
MTRGQAAILRFVLICAAWAVGQTLTWGLTLGPVGVVIPAALAIGTLVVTEDLGRPRASGGDLKYWRGRRVDDEQPRRPRVDDHDRRDRWN